MVWGKNYPKGFLPKFWLFCHNFATRNTKKPIKDSNFSLVPRKLESKSFL